MTTKLTFNIIYTPGTVRYLYFFVISLLKWSDCVFRLVSNGCQPEEIELLRQFCRQNHRLEFVELPFNKLIEHSQAIYHLQSLEKSDYFCIMDSDILATDDFLTPFMPYWEQCAGLFACSSSWCKAEEQILPTSFLRVLGRHNHTDQGICLGSTFFAIYHNQTLSQLMRTSGITFSVYQWPQIPTHFQDLLTRLELAKIHYDTGKLLNLLLFQEGQPLVFKENNALHHVGGLSIARQQMMPRSVFRRIGHSFYQSGRALKQMAIRLARNNGVVTHHQLTRSEESARRIILERKFIVSRYFTRLLCALVENQSLPARPAINDAEIAAKIARTTTAITNLYQSVK